MKNKKSAHVMNWRNRTKLKLIEYKGGKCERCGYNKPIPAVYDFHHTNPKEKEFCLGGSSFSFERLKSEADKCCLLCKNCHAEVHWELSDDQRQKRLAMPRRKFIKPRPCGLCNKEFSPQNSQGKFCSDACAKKASRKVPRPSKRQLRREIEKMTWVAIGRKHGVSDNAVRKWARAYCLLD